MESLWNGLRIMFGDAIKIPVQINGVKQTHIWIAPGTSQEIMERKALKNKYMKSALRGALRYRVVAIPDRIVNVVTKRKVV